MYLHNYWITYFWKHLQIFFLKKYANIKFLGHRIVTAKVNFCSTPLLGAIFCLSCNIFYTLLCPFKNASLTVTLSSNPQFYTQINYLFTLRKFIFTAGNNLGKLINGLHRLWFCFIIDPFKKESAYEEQLHSKYFDLTLATN